jgi:hypothetical protein
LATEIGYKEDNVPNTYICSSLNYVSCIMDLLTKEDAWKNQKWKTYYYYIVFRQLIRFHSKWRLIYYEFHGKFVKGQPIPWPKEIYPVFGLSLCYLKNILNETKNSNILIMLKTWRKIY